MKITNTAFIAALMISPTLVLAQTAAVTTSITADAMVNDDVQVQVESQNNARANEDMMYVESEVQAEENVETNARRMMEVTTTSMTDLGAEVEAGLETMLETGNEIMIDVDAEIEAGADAMAETMHEMKEDGAEMMNDVQADLAMNAEVETEASTDEDAGFFVSAWISLKGWFGFGN